jgi:exodeoxyribonuclease-3
MKITTWNVNGLRAVVAKNAFNVPVINSTDVLCLQEIKARPEQLPDEARELTGFSSYWNPALRPGYSGVAMYAKTPPKHIEMGLGDNRFDDEGRVVKAEFEQFTLYGIYFPNGQRGQERVSYKLDFYERLLEQCDELHSKGRAVIITGDFNTAHREIDLANPKENETTSGFLPEERVEIDKFLAHGFVDVYRSLYPDKVQYTWWTYRFQARKRNIGWRLDYFLVSQAIVESVSDVVVYDQVLGSDHCPVELNISLH